MTQPPGTTASRRGRPRREAVDRAVVEAVLRLLAEGAGFADLSMEGIAREAGVGKATVYRRWPGKDALLLDVLATLDPQPHEPATGSLRGDLVAVVDAVRLRSVAKRESVLMRNVLTQIHSNPQLWRRYNDTIVLTRRRAVARILERGIADGEIRPELGDDMELLVDMVVGPVLSRAVLHPDAPLADDLPERVVDTLIDGMRPRA
ncbi:TetR/AcrR family transcriptional regulator [Streptomyces sp. NPDC051976]|uniref:TetR/AcrR family transcriptional regulator n=1 Tax=Streptomyces sp. NPDC051976 TaxID=3154947 RepID=UPI00344AD96D